MKSKIKSKKLSQIDAFLDRLSKINGKAVYPMDLKEAVIGYVERFGMTNMKAADLAICVSNGLKC